VHNMKNIEKQLVSKICLDCPKEIANKPIDQFRKTKLKTGRKAGKIIFASICKECERFYKRNWYKEKHKNTLKKRINTKYDENIANDIKKLYADELGTRKIAEKLNLTRSIVQRYFIWLDIDNSERKAKKIRPLPDFWICSKCPENGLQSADNFKVIKRGNSLGFKYCIKCIRKLNAKRLKARRIRDPQYKIKCCISASIRDYFKNNQSSKDNKSVLKYLLYSISDLKTHIESLFEPWMTWKNHGKYNSKTWNDNDQSTWTWQLDHIIPQSTFKYNSMDCEEFRKCWALSNLRPYSAKQNIKDGYLKIRH
jgi:hypothetical protein